MRWLILCFILLSLFCFHTAWARSIPGQAYAGIGGDMEVYDLSKTNGGNAYETKDAQERRS